MFFRNWAYEYNKESWNYIWTARRRYLKSTLINIFFDRIYPKMSVYKYINYLHQNIFIFRALGWLRRLYRQIHFIRLGLIPNCQRIMKCQIWRLGQRYSSVLIIAIHLLLFFETNRIEIKTHDVQHFRIINSLQFGE